MRRVLVVVSMVVASLAVGLASNISPALAAVPSGFTDTAISVPGANPLSSPTGIVSLPGNRGLILEQGGTARILTANGTVLAADALSLHVCSSNEMGLLGAAVDPGFILNGFVYLYYTHDSGDCSSSGGRGNRVSRFTMSGDSIVPSSEVVLLDNIQAKGGNHNGGDLEVGQDGYLYVSIGDSGQNPRGLSGSSAKDLSLLNGKIVRITTTGGVPPDNPFVGDPKGVRCATAGLTTSTASKCLEVYSWGLRNPYRFAFDPNTGSTRFFINDVGENTWEEVDQGGKGLNYGWSDREGFCAQGSTTDCSPPTPAGLTDPLTTYQHPDCSFITAAAFVPNGWWPSEYDGSYLFGDGGCNNIFRRTAAGAVDYDTPFASVSGTIVDMAFIAQGSDPSLFYVTNSGTLHRITYDVPATATSPALAFTPAAAYRAYDSRDDGPIRAGSTRYIDLHITGANVRAAMVNLTMVQPIGAGHLTAWQGRTERPATSNVNAPSAGVVANGSIVPVGPDGKLLVYAAVTSNVVVDVMGTFTEVSPGVSGGRYTSLSPARLIDTRNGGSASNTFTRATSGISATTVNAPLRGRLGVPANATSVALIVTGVSDPTGIGGGYITAYAGGAAEPATSNLNLNEPGDIRPNLVFTPLGADGSINLKLFQTKDVVVDVAGYFTNATGSAGMYHVTAPTRQVDSRTPLGFGPLGVGGIGILDPGAPVPSGAKAISQNVTMTATVQGGFVTSYPSDTARPLASNANATGFGQDRAALTVTQVGANGAGAIAYFSSGGTHLVVDVTGYFE